MNNNRILKEWLDANGKKVNTTASQPTPATNEKMVYIWDMYIDKEDKGNWRSADDYRGVWEGFVYESEFEAIKYGRKHLKELEDEGELRGSADDYDVEAFAVPISKVSKSTRIFSGI